MNTKKNKNTDSPHFREFFLDQIKDVYWAEKHLSSGLKKMRKAATSPKLAAAFEKHIEETAGQIERLKRVFELLGKDIRNCFNFAYSFKKLYFIQYKNVRWIRETNRLHLTYTDITGRLNFPMKVIRSGLFFVFFTFFFYCFLKFEFQQIYRFFYCCYFFC